MIVDLELKRIIIRISGEDLLLDDISCETILTSDLEFNSVKMISLIVEIESFFNIRFDDEDLDLGKISVYGSLYKMVEKMVNN